jgi:signal transduction histidine kinase
MDRGSRAGIGLIVRASRFTGLGAVVAVGGLAALRIGLTGHPAAATPGELLPLLTAVALLCVVGLATRHHRTLAWLSTIGAAVIVTIDLAAYARTVRAEIDGVLWQWLVLAICLIALLGSSAAAMYAVDRRRLPRRAIVLASVAGIGTVLVASVAALAAAPDVTTAFAADSPLGNVRLVTRAVLVVVPLLTLVGWIGDVLPAAERATKRVGLTLEASTPRAARGVRVGAWLRAFGDEVGPGRTRARRAVLAERSSIARDLHADVVPALRRALADAQRAAPPERLAASLRQVLADVESLGAGRHAIQLEIGGLVAALEWLSEQVESRSDVTVTLDVADPSPRTIGAPPAEVAAAAFRVAGLALDNVVRHVPGSQVTISVTSEPDLVDLAIRDDGPGLSPDAIAIALANGRRGIPDMASEAAACGAEVRVNRADDGVGSVVNFRWESGSRSGG